MDIKYILPIWKIDICYLKQQKIAIHKNLYQFGQRNPPASMAMVTRKYIDEIYKFMEDVEYKYDV